MTEATHNPAQALAFIGFGEAGQAFSRGLGSAWAARTRAYDIKTDAPDAALRAAKLADYRRAGVTGCDSLAEALAVAGLVFSTVTADQALAAAGAAAARLAKDALYLDCNSCSPGAKRHAAERVEAAGGRYVDSAVMAPVHPGLHRTPILLSGPHAEAAAAALAGLGMNAEVTEGPVGAAASVKMVRSIMMKGLEALFVECVLAGRRAGVDERVLASLDRTYPGFDFKQKAAYMLERVMTHGRRRAAEMDEAALTVEETGLSGRMARAARDWQAEIGALGLRAEGADYGALADALLARLSGEEPAPPAADYHDIPGTYVFDAEQSRKGYHLNMFCMSLRRAENRRAFQADEAAYLDRFPMTAAQRQAVLGRAWNEMLRLGGNIYYTAKLAANDGITFQDLAATMSGVDVETYRKMMLAGGRPIEGNRSLAERANG